MRFGVFLPTMPCWYRTSTVRTAVDEVARAAEALGFASVWANDVVIHPPAAPSPSSRTPH
jgi:hypothetical protein